jgi:DNA (cytosine-5)-methyltransferase 1
MRYGSLFSGIGGMDLGLDRAGMECRWQVEIDPFCRKVLAKHWPNVARFEDVRNVGKHNLEPVDLIAGGFPCQDISQVGRRREGINGYRSSLWFEFYRIICELRPRFMLVENVSDLLVRGMGAVLGCLASIGYDAEWQVLPASAFGLPHKRNRVFIIAYPSGSTSGIRWEPRLPEITKVNWQGFLHTNGKRKPDGFPNRVDRLRGLGNAVVPAVAQWIGERIMECQN